MIKFMNRLKMEKVSEDGAPAAAQAAPAVGEPVYKPAPVTEAPAPVAEPQAPQPVPEEPKQKLNYDNPAAKQTGDMLSAAGVDPLKARDAVTANGGQCTPEIYEALVKQHGEGMASLLATQMTQLHKQGVEKGNAQDQAVYDQVQEAFKGVTEQSGKETWNELSAWAKTNVPTDQQKELNKLLGQGGMAAQLAVQELTNAFQKSGEYTQPMEGIEGDNVPNAPKGGDLTRSDYNTELDALLAKGHNYETSREVKALQARRAKSAQRGYN